MRTIYAERVVKIPKNVELTLNRRHVTVKGERGVLSKDFKHRQIHFVRLGKKSLKVEVWCSTTKEKASLRTLTAHIENMITGVTKGFEFKMRFAYAHFPINVTINDKNDQIQIHNFLGEKIVREINMLDGVTIRRSEKKDEIILTGNSLENVSQSAATIQQSCAAKNKDIRKFLDGIYVSERRVLGDE